MLFRAKCGQTTIASIGLQATVIRKPLSGVREIRPVLSSVAKVDDYRWLIGAEGRRWLAEAEQDGGELPQQTRRLRKSLSAVESHLVLEQVALRRRAMRKFPAARRMFFTARGLEQASDQWVAAYKASRFPAGVELADLCCGIGGDLLALADRGPAIGVERDPITALLAQANLAELRRGTSDQAAGEVLTCDIAQAPLAEVAAWHIDPDRRPQGRRTTRVELHEPGVPAIERLLTAQPSGAIKLAPAAELPAPWSSAAELEWISRGGECKQLVAWFGALAAAPGLHRASVVTAKAERPARSAAQQANAGCQPPGRPQATDNDQPARDAPAAFALRTLVGRPSQELPVAEQIGRYLAEPDAAVLAAELTGVLAAEHELAAIAATSAYLTGDRVSPDAALAWFEITDVLPFDVKRLKALLRERRCGRLEIKKRGVPHDPETVRRQLRVPGENAATLFITRIGDAVVAILARRIGLQTNSLPTG